MLFEVEGFQPLEVAAQPVRVVGAHAVRADLCGVSKSQVDKWLSTVPIPAARQRLIDRIMKEEYAKHARAAQIKNPNSIHVPVTPQRYEKFRSEAERHGLTVPEWASEALDALSNIKCKR